MFLSTLSKKRKKKNYQEILYEYLKMLLSSKNILKLISKEIKANFFKNMNDVMVNKHDELKYLILTKENYRNYKIKSNYFQKWKKLSGIDNSIKEMYEFDINNKIYYNLYKSMNSLSGYPKLNTINIKYRKNSLHRYDNEDELNEINEISNDNIALNPKINININNVQNNLKICKNNDLYFINKFNIKNENIPKNNELHLEIKRIENFDSKCIKKKLEINNNFDIKFIGKSDNNNNKNLNNTKGKNLLNIFKITKNIQFKILNKYQEKNLKTNILENCLQNGQDIVYNNLDSKKNNNKELLRNKNTNDKKNKYIEKIENNKKIEDKGYIPNLLIIVAVILLGAFIINYFNIDN